MIVTVFEVIYVSNIDGNFELNSWVKASFEEAKELFDKQVQQDLDSVKESAYCRNVRVLQDVGAQRDEEPEDGDYLYELSETSYTSWVYGDFATSFVSIDIKEHTLEVK